MQKPRRALLLPLLLFSAAASAELLQPECAILERWAQDFSAEHQGQLSRRAQQPITFQDGALESHFGQPLPEWERDDFRSAHRLLSACSKEARRRRDHDTSNQLQALRNAINAQEGALRESRQARERATAAVQTLTAGPDSQALANTLVIAQAALKGEEVRGQMRSLPYEQQRQILQLSTASPHLLQEDSAALSAQLGERQAAVEAAIQAEEQEAVAQLQTASEDLATLPDTAEGLQALDRLHQHPALAQAPEAEARAFRSALQQRREQILTVQHEQQTKAAAMIVDQALEELQSMEVGQLQDLGRMWEFGDRTSQQLAQQGAYGEARRFVEVFKQRFGQASDEQLPEFRTRLAEIPATEAGLKRLGGAVRNLTGIGNRSAPLDAYHQAVQERGQAITAEMKQAACEQTWKAAGLSKGEAKQALWGAGEPTDLGMFVCALSERGHQINLYEGGGLFSDTHTLRFTEKDGGFHTLKMHPGEVQPGKEMLLGYELADANQTRPLSVKEWEDYAGELMSGGNADCNRLASKSRSELSLNETMELMGCVMGMMPDL